MKSKFLRLVSIVTLSAFLAMTAVVCPATAATSTNTDDCVHPVINLVNIKRFFPNVSTTSHQAADLYVYRCTECKKEFYNTKIIGTFEHTLDKDGVCTECHYSYQ